MMKPIENRASISSGTMTHTVGLRRASTSKRTEAVSMSRMPKANSRRGSMVLTIRALTAEPSTIIADDTAKSIEYVPTPRPSWPCMTNGEPEM